ncbi:MAG: serine racemase VanT catalytic subunit [Roseburia sp.]|nr:serine racemase VanT catalytic subunit [Roseburia sp.]
MNENENYGGIDVFRMLAALLIIAIHTSPLASFTETGDLILTRIVARVAVPFFFMTSGFFLISRYTCDGERLRRFLKRTALFYGAGILFYLPVNLYNGYFKRDALLPNILKDIVFDGTLYHLWYLPASLLGGTVAWFLVKKLDYKRVTEAALGLYVLGLLGDSYYGITERIPGLRGLYELLFQLFDYTRNGLFFAPVFFVMGGFLAEHRYRDSPGKSMAGFFISLICLLSEGMLLHHFALPRHDSMYVFLLPCVFFLFYALLHFRGKRFENFRTASLIIYIIHPMVIVVLRLFAKLFGLQKLLVQNSAVHYLTVCLLSVSSGMVMAALWKKVRPVKVKHNPNTERAYVEIDLRSLEHNVRTLQRAMPPMCRLMAVVKAEGYGHGASVISVHLSRMGVRAFAVATIDEGIKLRKCGVRGEILILGYTDVQRASELKKYDLSQTLIDFAYAEALNKRGIGVKAHIKIDTGMHRLGIESRNTDWVAAVFDMRKIQVQGMFTHLCCAESHRPDDISFTRGQIDSFYSLVEALKERGIAIPRLHVQSSYGFWNYPGLRCDYVRAGIALYGVLSSPGDITEWKLELRPVLSLKSRVVLIRSICRGDSVGYDRSFIARRDSRIAILPVGYGDGYPRHLSCGSGSVQIRQYCVPVIGRICMDSLAVDITDAPDVAIGDVAILIGGQDDMGISAPDVADNAGSISNELLCRMGARLPVVTKYDGGS